MTRRVLEVGLCDGFNRGCVPAVDNDYGLPSLCLLINKTYWHNLLSEGPFSLWTTISGLRF